MQNCANDIKFYFQDIHKENENKIGFLKDEHKTMWHILGKINLQNAKYYTYIRNVYL